jgi:hypothetical protein
MAQQPQDNTQTDTSAETAVPEKKESTKSNKKMKTSEVKDNISKGRTVTGGLPDKIIMNPVLEDAKKLAEKIAQVLDRNNTHLRDDGSSTLTAIYKADTPGQSKEAVMRNDQDRKKTDLVPRSNQDRKNDPAPYRQQSIKKKIVDEAHGKNYKSPWNKIEKAKPGIGKRIDDAAAGLKQNAKDYQKILDKEKEKNEAFTAMFEVAVNSAGFGGVRGMGYVTGGADVDSGDYTGANVANADTHDNIMAGRVQDHNNLHAGGSAARSDVEIAADTDKGKTAALGAKQQIGSTVTKSAVTVAKSLAKEEVEVTEISKRLTHSFISHMIAQHPDTISMTKAKGKDVMRKKALDLAIDKENPKSAIYRPHVLATEDATSTKDPLAHLEDKLNKASDKSHDGIDKIMRGVANDFNMDVHDLHDRWVKKYKNTPDQYVKEDSKPWNTPNPNKTHHHLSPAKKAEAKARAKAAGRPYPNLVDNMAVAKEDINDLFAEFTGCAINEESDIEGLVQEIFYSFGDEQYEDWGEINEEAEHEGKHVKLGKPFLTPGGPKKRAVYVKNDKGNVVKVNFGDPHLSIKRDQPSRKKSYRARHHCETPGPRWTANYWSCKYWSSTPTSELDKG